MNTTPPETKPIRISVSQVQKVQRCKRAYWFEYGPLKRKSPSTPNQQLGTDVHAVLEDYQRDGTPLPETRAGRIASAGLKHLRDPDTLEIEKNVLMPIGDEGARILCRIDMLGADEPYVGDHKTSSDFKWCKSVYEVKNDVQLLTYAYAAYHEEKPAEVEVELVYYRTRGLPLSMAVSAVVPWSRIEENWQEVESKIPGMVEIRANDTGEGIEGNSAACGDYGGCFHCDVCPFSPEALDKTISRDNIVSEAHPKTPETVVKGAPHTAKTQNSKGDTVNKKQKNLQKALGLSRILPKGAPPQEEQTPALIKDAAAKLAGAVSFNGAITPDDALNFLEREGIDDDRLDEVLSLAGLEINDHDMIDFSDSAAIASNPGARTGRVTEPVVETEPVALCWDCENSIGGAVGNPDFPWRPRKSGEACGAADCWNPEPETEPAVETEPAKAPFEKVDTKTLETLAVELSDVFIEGVSETDARAYCEGRIPHNKSISDRRWARIVEFSDLTLDGGWLYPGDVEGHTEHPQAHDGETEPTGAELDRAEYEKKTGKKAPTPEPETAPDREGYTFTEGITKAEGMVTTGFLDDEPHVAVFIGDGDTPIMIPAGALVGSISETVEGAFQTTEESLDTPDTPEPRREGLTVLVDCLFEATPEGAITLSDYLAPFRTLVEKQHQKSYYELDEMGKGRKMVAGKVLAAVHESAPTGVLLVDSRETGAGDILAILRRIEGVSIVRAIR